MQDILLVSITSGALTTYFAEEVEATVESVLPYLYSANLKTKKRLKWVSAEALAGDIIGAMHITTNFLGIYEANFIAIDRPVDDKLMWQDPSLTKWQGSASRDALAKLEEKHNWENG